MGGGDCDRSRFRFKNDTDIEMAEQEDYSKSDFDMGHLANAEDFAFDCKKDEMTFRFYNCLPQYPNLNRGAWKRWENTIRKDSRLDSLRIICGGHEYIREIDNAGNKAALEAKMTATQSAIDSWVHSCGTSFRLPDDCQA